MTLEQTVQALRERIGLLEDRLEISQLIASYGPAVDSGAASAVAGIWTEDGTYDTVPKPLNGRQEIEAMVGSEGHQSLIHAGCAHVLGPPVVQIHGDTAVAICYSQVFVKAADGDGFRVWRASANRWTLTRGPDGWRVTSRVNRALDGSAEARAVLGDIAVEG